MYPSIPIEINFLMFIGGSWQKAVGNPKAAFGSRFVCHC
jgi:hypothetical protein